MSEEEISQLLYRSAARKSRTAVRAQLESVLVITGLTAIMWSLILLVWSAHV